MPGARERAADAIRGLGELRRKNAFFPALISIKGDENQRFEVRVVSTRVRHSPFAADDGSNKPLFRNPAPEGRRVIWRDLHPILLRSAGVVGLAGVIVAVVASAPVSDRPAAETRTASSPLLPGNAVGATSLPKAEDDPAPAEARQRLAALSGLPERADSPPPELVKAAAEANSRETATPEATALAPAEVQARAVAASADPAPAPATLDGAPARDAAAAKLAIRAALAPETAVPATEQAEAPSLWAEEATKCPRDWLAWQGSGSAGDGASGCTDGAAPTAPSPETAAETPETGPAAPATVASLAAEPGELANEALTLAPAAIESEGLTSDLVAPLPRVRPDPPANAIKKPTRTRTASRGKLGPPPNCGKKYARWRYVNKQPTWYCK